MTCAHFVSPDQPCAKGVDLQALAGGGIFYMVMRLPCLPISNRHGQETKPCVHNTEHEKEPS